MAINTLQKLGSNIALIKDETSETPTLESGVFLFISFDLADSTAFKTEHPSLWATVFTNFYGQILQKLDVENYRISEGGKETSVCVRKLWKLIGDEVLLYVQISDLKQLYEQVLSVNAIVTNLLEEIADKVEKEVKDLKCDNACTRHCQDVKEVITSLLGIKTTMWVAECHKSKDTMASNIVYRPLTAVPDSGRIDFLGRDIDEGFRIAKYAVKDKIIISPLLAWLIWKEAQENQDKKKIIDSNFKITAFVLMKGVWRNRKVPIIMFHQQFNEFDKILAYDDLDLETYSNIKNEGFRNFKGDGRFAVEQIDNILNHVYRKKDAEKLYKRLEKEIDVEMFSQNIEKLQELHIACIIFNGSGQVLIHDDKERGLEFGCIKKIFGMGSRTWREVCTLGYKEKYGLSIEVKENPIPIATYYYEKRNAFGLIVIADFVGNEDELIGKEEWRFYSEQEIQETDTKMVDNFKDNFYRARELRESMENKDE